jgi:hypothetical protein
VNRLPQEAPARARYHTARDYLANQWPLVAAAAGGALFFAPAPTGEHLMGVVLCPREQNADGIERALGSPWLRVSLVGVTHAEEVVARIEDTLRRWRTPAPALDDEIVRAQSKRAESMEPLKARDALRAAARTLQLRAALTVERASAIKAELLATKARLQDVRRN